MVRRAVRSRASASARRSASPTTASCSRGTGRPTFASSARCSSTRSTRRRCVADALEAGLDVGTPAEKAGAFPLAWSTDPFERALTGAFVKVLVRYRPDDEEAIRDGQWQKLDALQTWCRGAGKPLVIEILVARRGEPEDEFEAVGRPAMLAGFIREAYRRELTPQFWKIEGTLAREGARTIDRAIAANAACRQIILGKAAEIATIGRWFAAAADSPTAIRLRHRPIGVLGAVGRILERREDGGPGGRGHRRQLPPTRGRLAPKPRIVAPHGELCSATSATLSGRSLGSLPSPPSPS